jgi:hypothetical protein
LGRERREQKSRLRGRKEDLMAWKGLILSCGVLTNSKVRYDQIYQIYQIKQTKQTKSRNSEIYQFKPKAPI